MSQAQQQFVKAVLAIGGNLGDREQTLKSAIEQLAQHPAIRVLAISPFVESHAVAISGIDPTAPKYLNGVVEIETNLKPKQLLEAVRKVESDHGRVRLERWGSRTLDIDIIVYSDVVKAGKELTLPHPRASERAFVVVPWSLIAPEAVLPGFGKVAKLAEDLADQVWIPA